MSAASRFYSDLDLLIERHQSLHQAFKRNILEFVAGHLRYLGLCHAGDRGGLGLTEPPALDELVELDGKDGFRGQFFRVVEPKVDQHIVSALVSVFASHHYLPLNPCRASTAFNRFSINCTSGCGVLMPDFDFF